jgi:hypothetical protein
MKICALIKKGFHEDEPKKYRSLVLGGEWFCSRCGHVAVGKDMLCYPKGKKKKKKEEQKAET